MMILVAVVAVSPLASAWMPGLIAEGLGGISLSGTMKMPLGIQA